MDKYQVHRMFFCKSSSLVGESIYTGPNKTRKWKHKTIQSCFHCLLCKFWKREMVKVENVFSNQTMSDMVNNFVSGKNMSGFNFLETDFSFQNVKTTQGCSDNWWRVVQSMVEKDENKEEHEKAFKLFLFLSF